jgi:WD40 repeat protein
VRVGGAAFSGDGKRLLITYRIDHPDPKAATPKPLALWDVASGKKLWATGNPVTEQFRPVGFLPDGKSLIVIKNVPKERQGALEIWDIGQGKRVRAFAEVPKEEIGSATLSADGKVVLASVSGSLKLWDVGSGELVRAFAKSDYGGTGLVVLSPDGKRALSAHVAPFSAPKCSTNLWEVQTGKAIHSFENSEGWTAPMDFSPDGKQAIIDRYDSEERKDRLVLWDIAGAKLVKEFKIGADVVSFTPDGRSVVVGSHHDGREVRLTLMDLTGTGFWPSGDEPTKLRLWDLSKGELLRTLDDSSWANGR